MKRVLATAALLLASAIMAEAKNPALVNRPEVFIEGVTKKEVLNPIVTAMMKVGASIVRQSDYEMVFGKPYKGMVAMILAGSTYNPTPEDRAVFSIVEETNGVRLFLTEQIVTNPNSPFERVTTLDSKKNYANLQRLLDRIRASILESKGPDQPAPASAPAARAGEPAPRPVPTTPSDTASILIESTPMDAEVYIDGNFVGTTPYRVTRASAEKHLIEIKKPGYLNWSKELTIIEGSRTQFSANLVPISQ
jgi:hypothetical protein